MSRILIIWAVFHSLNCFSGEAEINEFRKGNRKYKEGRYTEALTHYSNLLNGGYESSTLHYNTGNAYYRTDSFPQAILHYEKALKLNPENEDARYNLRLANSKIRDKITPLPEIFIVKYWNYLVRSKTPAGWAFLSIQIFILALLVLGIYFVSAKQTTKKVTLITSSVLIVVFLFTVLFAFKQRSFITGGKYAIMMHETINVMSAPGTTGSRLFVIHAGTKVEITGRSDEWNEIRLLNGEKGWVKSTSLNLI